MKTLYLSDLDGTLLNRESALSNFTVSIVNNLLADGVSFSVATARSYTSFQKVTKPLHLALPVILNNGVFIKDPVSGGTISSIFFSAGEIAYIAAAFCDASVFPLVYSMGGERERVTRLSGCETPGMQTYLKSRPGDPRFCAADSLLSLFSGDIFYFTAIDTEETLLPLYEHFSNDERVSCYLQKELYCDDYWFEITPKLAGKAAAAKKLKELLGCDRLVAFGDHLNDVGMLEAADYAVVPENAEPAVKALADEIVESNDRDGVAKWLFENAKN